MMRILTTLLLLTAACGSSSSPAAPSSPPSDPPTTPASEGPAPTYTELFDTLFAPGKPGHCATAGCHDDPGHNEWLCGNNRDSCYAGMVEVGLINPSNPTQSMIADPTLSPLVWFNPAGGNMPFDAQMPNQAGRDAIAAWVAAGAKND